MIVRALAACAVALALCGCQTIGSAYDLPTEAANWLYGGGGG